jgi:hypothetical protein
MPFWDVKIYEDKNRSSLRRRGLVDAPTEAAAVEIAIESMGDAQLAELDPLEASQLVEAKQFSFPLWL